MIQKKKIHYLDLQLVKLGQTGVVIRSRFQTLLRTAVKIAMKKMVITEKIFNFLIQIHSYRQEYFVCNTKTECVS